MRRCILLFLFLGLSTSTLLAQTPPSAAPAGPARPKLVVGIVVDQMRYDYIYRFWNKFGNTGFKRLYNQGVFCSNTHFNYVPTNTAPGHSSIYTGATPAIHGIVGNEWYSRDDHRVIYCTSDTAYRTVGAKTTTGRMSPRRLLTTTITDELRLSNNFRSKVIAIALKDRGAILPGGHNPTGAFFFDDTTGIFVTSSYYGSAYLPDWLVTFNKLRKPDQYLSQPWNTIKPIETYTESIEDANSYEKSIAKKDTFMDDSIGKTLAAKDTTYKVKRIRDGAPTFPIDLPDIFPSAGYGLLRNTPFGNNITTDVAIAAMEGEGLGKRDYTDFISISYSSTDYIGHLFGPYSKEIEDCYIRFDDDLGRLLSYLDKTYGMNNVLIFLTADHGVADVPKHMTDQKMPAGLINGRKVQDTLKQILQAAIGDTLVLSYYNQQVYLRHDNVDDAKLKKAKGIIKDFFMNMKGVQDVSMTAVPFSGSVLPDDQSIARGYLASRCGDMVVKMQPGWFEGGSKKGTTHSAPYNYDTHVPLFWYGYGITPKKIVREISITDIAPTLAQFMKIQEPNGSIGKVIEEIVK